MARHEHLPIYRECFELCVFLERAVAGIGRYHKCGLGTRILGSAGQENHGETQC